jgi:lipopolysaccharide/colanic/teichoic acid biosynthesis glycosyltransferase
MIYPQPHFLERLREERHRSDRNRSPFTLVVFPLNEAAPRKAVATDLDRALRYLTRTTRRSDLWGYYGERELGLLLPDTREVAARRLLSRLAAQLACSANSKRSVLTLQQGRYTLIEYPTALHHELAKEKVRAPERKHEKRSALHLAKPSLPTNGRLEHQLLEQTSLSRLQQIKGPRATAYRVSKRALDLVGATVGILLSAIPSLPIALLIKTTSKGPVLFKQTRIGQNGQEFTFLKFRTMYHNCDQSLHRDYVTRLIEEEAEQHQSDDGEAYYKLADDPRITPVGRILRKTSLDELPQFINVLRGEMSLVGPRPPIGYEVEKYEPWKLRRILEAMPGITGLWQVSGRSSLTFTDQVRLDLRYVENQSLWQDIRILVKTFQVVFKRKDAC